MQNLPDPLLIAALFGVSATLASASEIPEGACGYGLRRASRAGHTVELDLVYLGHRRDVSGHGAVDLDVLSSLQHEQVANLERLAIVADEKLRISRDRALVDAENPELAHERIHHHLEHVREDMLLRVGLGTEFDRVFALALDEQGRISLGGIRQQFHEDVQEPGFRRHFAPRRNTPVPGALRARPFQTARAAGRRNLALFEVERHQCFVDFHDLVNQGAMGVGDGRKIGLARGLEKQSTTRWPLSEGRLIGRHSLPNAD